MERKRGTLRRLVKAVAAVSLLAAGSARATDTAFFSFRGTMTTTTPGQDFVFNLGANSTSMTFRTYAYKGGTNAAGENIVVPPNGIDSILDLYDSTPTLLVENDDINTPPGTIGLAHQYGSQCRHRLQTAP